MLVEKIISGDVKAFEKLFNSYYERLAFYAYNYLKDKESAEDVVQELFTKLWVNRQQLSVELSLNAYLYTSVRNACLNHLKHRKVKEAHLASSVIPMMVDNYIPNEIDAKDLGHLIQSAIMDLPPERQKIFLLSREQGLKYQEIAVKLGISVKTVESQMGKALRFLRESLKEFLMVLILFFIAWIEYI